MILSGKEIKRLVDHGQIYISDFDESRLNPNSYNLRLGEDLLVYDPKYTVLDMKQDNPTRKLIIPPEGLVLQPGQLYLARTMEYTKTHGCVPMLEGRSSIGRLGLSVHVTAGFGDIGFEGYWTLEMWCLRPIRIYAGVDICQIYYHAIKGNYDEYKKGKYQKNEGIQASKLYLDFETKEE